MSSVKAVKTPEKKETFFDKFLNRHPDLLEVIWKLEKIWDKITLYHFRRRIKFAYDYGRFAFKYQYDFDYVYIWSLLEFKLKRSRESMRQTVYDDDCTRALDLAIKLCRRLHKHDYSARLYAKSRARWGEGKMVTEPDERGYFTLDFVYDDMSEEAKAERLEETRYIMKMEDSLRKRDSKWLFDIMQKYIWGWWD